MYQPSATFAITDNVTLYAQYTTDASVIKKQGPAGGLVFYDYGSIHTDGNGTWQYLEAAPASLGNMAWDFEKHT